MTRLKVEKDRVGVGAKGRCIETMFDLGGGVQLFFNFCQFSPKKKKNLSFNVTPGGGRVTGEEGNTSFSTTGGKHMLRRLAGREWYDMILATDLDGEVTEYRCKWQLKVDFRITVENIRIVEKAEYRPAPGIKSICMTMVQFD